ncbi:MAG: cell envelope integrity protein CreD [Roseitalea sp.]|nr:cell envelope integrity protein CreD [Roseitalea sp.]MBO6721103.1 cell envelope integrity protein CreD [Roseitalea sp.]MBO6742825.1 cell envelope integrity protein CreD [Roseitalea sp.]
MTDTRTWEQPGPSKRWSGGLSLGTKFFVLGVLAVTLSIPLFAVWLLVQDREANYRRAVAEIGAQWGGSQTLTGPLLAVPVTVLSNVRDQNGGTVQRRVGRTLLIAPQALDVTGQVDPARRKRGIHEAIVYQSRLTVRARFGAPDLDALSPPVVAADWTRGKLVMALSDLKGIETVAIISGDDELDGASPGFGIGAGAQQSGFHVPVDLSGSFADGGAPAEFVLDLAFKGSQTLRFSPVGAETRVTLTSPWPHPSFAGAFLPATRTVSEAGFEAHWAVPQLARSIPSAMIAEGGAPLATFPDAQFGVDLYQPVHFYRFVDRAVKYGVLFVGAAFLVIFAIEVMSGGRMHLAHYMMTGLMMIIFYVLLLALAEMIGFAAAYAMAAGATGVVVAGFTATLFSGRIWAFSAFGGFALLYGSLYLVLSLEEAALLAGGIAAFAIVTAMMFGTRKVDWSAGGSPAAKA